MFLVILSMNTVYCLESRNCYGWECRRKTRHIL